MSDEINSLDIASGNFLLKEMATPASPGHGEGVIFLEAGSGNLTYLGSDGVPKNLIDASVLSADFGGNTVGIVVSSSPPVAQSGTGQLFVNQTSGNLSYMSPIGTTFDLLEIERTTTADFASGTS